VRACVCLYVVKVTFALERATKAQRGIELQLYSFLTSALEGLGGQLHAPAVYPRERPGTHCVGCWVSPRAGLDGCGISGHPPGFDPRTVQPERVAIPTTLSRLPCVYLYIYIYVCVCACVRRIAGHEGPEGE